MSENKKCIRCGHITNEADAKRCSICGAFVFSENPNEHTQIDVYMSEQASFGECLYDYKGKNYTVEQLQAIYNCVRQIKLTFIFDGNELIDIEVPFNTE